MTTIVSAFIYLENNKHRSLEKYIEFGSKLLELNQNKIIFIDEKVYDKFEKYKNDKTILIKTRLCDLYLYKYKEQLKNLKVNTCNPIKDTFEYFIIQCNKTEWIREAISLNLFECKQFIWIDFGIFYLLPEVNVKPKVYDKVRIPSIWNLNVEYQVDIMRDISWYFAGGVFGGNIVKLIEFADLMKEKCTKLVEKDNHLMWEVNIWYLIWKDNKDLFDPYKADHNLSIIDKY